MDEYTTLKASGNITVDSSSTPSTLVVNLTQHDPITGATLAPAQFSYDLAMVNDKIALIQPQLANWQAMLADFPSQ